MAVTPPLPIDDLPVSPSPDRPDVFDAEADDFLNGLQPWGQQVEAVGQNAYANATAAATSATAAAGSATAAATSATAAAGSATAAATSATAAATSAAGITATSTTSLAVGNGTKVFTVPAGKQFLTNVPMVAVSAGTPTAKIFGDVVSYSGTTLTLNATSSEGTGTFNDWNISPAGTKGATGGTAGGQLTSALDEIKGTAPASSATPDIWNAGGNYVPITQTASITGFPNAPQAGAGRKLFCVNGFPLVSSANLAVAGGTRNIAPGDLVVVTADTVSTFKAYIVRGNGLPVSSQVFARAEMYTTSATFVAKIAGPHRAYLVGPGGSGGCSGGPNNNFTASATGGGAGGLVIKDFDALASAAYTYLAGAPGASVASGSSAGNAGSASTFSGTGVSLTANGGGGGTFSTNTVAALAGAAGGTATGGDYNYQGGGSGGCAANTITTGGSRSAQATGGGAVAWKGLGYSSGNAAVLAGNAGSSASASGGAGIGGQSGDVTATVTGIISSGGGGSAGPSATATSVSTTGGPGGNSLLATTPLNLNGDGNAGQAGGGSPGAAGGQGGTLTGLAAGPLGGAGGVAVPLTGNPIGGAPGLGAGSGGCASGSGNPVSAAGGGSFLLVLY